MSEPLDIHTVLQNGYFKTSRAKNSPPDQSPSSSPPKPNVRNDYRVMDPPKLRRPRIRPPPPTVEDEVDALAKEYGGLSLGGPKEEEVQSRGDMEQYPVIMEVHEHNPERRFVIVPNSTEEPQAKPKDDGPDPARRKEGRPGDEKLNAPPSPRIYEPVFDDRPNVPTERPAVGRRKSRQDLPPIDTAVRQDRSPEHHRTRSAAGPRPDGFSARSSQSRDGMLSPDVIKQGSSRREKPYYDYSSPSSTPRRPGYLRTYSNFADDRRRERRSRRGSLSPAPGGRSESHPDPRKSRRRLSNERGGESRYRDDPARSSRREANTSLKRDSEVPQSASIPKPRGPRPCREDGRPIVDIGSNPRTSGRRRGNSTSIHQDAEPIPSPEKERGPWNEDRSKPKEPTVPVVVPPVSVSVPPNEVPANPRASATFPITSEEYQAHLPYPDDISTGRSGRLPAHQAQGPQSTSMPDIPLTSSTSPEKSFETPQTATSGTSKASAWPPSFDPERDGVTADQEMGSYRRYSEGRGGNAIPKFAECQRKEPMAGKMDWLTLPRTDINICPDCYQNVFANTEYRTDFQPMLRPTDKAIACDFGSSPWYRIAWLLTLKNEYTDLKLFYQVDSVAAASRNHPCPGSRKALRNWFTVRDPYNGRAVPNFNVCYQCAKTVEALLPKLAGTFSPLDSRAEPIGGICALHFKPSRRRFALYFDTLETTADKAVKSNDPPDVGALASKIERLSAVEECREDRPISDSYWHTMQFLPQFTVCAECFDQVVRPRLGNNIVARNFYKDPQRMTVATCQLYSERMREIFQKSCRRNDPKYLKARVLERMQVEADIHSQLVKLDKERHDEAWTEEQVGKLIREWKKWE